MVNTKGGIDGKKRINYDTLKLFQNLNGFLGHQEIFGYILD